MERGVEIRIELFGRWGVFFYLVWSDYVLEGENYGRYVCELDFLDYFFEL